MTILIEKYFNIFFQESIPIVLGLAVCLISLMKLVNINNKIIYEKNLNDNFNNINTENYLLIELK